MASSSLTPLKPTSLIFTNSQTIRPQRPQPTVRCGPRDNRGPLHKGRVLSSEAIQAIQALKRANSKSNSDDLDHVASKTLTRLVKADLLAAFHELLRQDQCDLALRVFSAVRSEIWYRPDCNLYAGMAAALARNGRAAEIDGVVAELEREGVGEGGGISRLIRGLVGAGRREAVVRVYGVMRREGVGVDDEYVSKVLSRGLKRLGEEGVAGQVERDFLESCEGVVGR
ncbi:hypothetical protein Sjap_020009 [Stephania japonica]|uniref:Pentatricopeptide repeat-containing protein n=1 Tax=Stephania japonica TaxID=461633 RepID=A0AAP0F2L7_9MAGN